MVHSEAAKLPLETPDVPSMPFPESIGKAKPTHRKKRGIFFTPTELAHFVVDWAVQSPSDRVMDPSCGEGVFLAESARRLRELGASAKEVASLIHGVDVLPSSAEKAARAVAANLDGLRPIIRGEDFFVAARNGMKSELFDAVVGNPPFVRYQLFNGPSRKAAAQLIESVGVRPSKLMNAWVPFVIGAAKMTRPGGRLGLILPAELLQVSHASAVRRYLTSELGFCHVIAFPQLQFDDALVEVIILLCQKGTSPGLTVVEARTAQDLVTASYPPQGVGRTITPREADGKWIRFLLTTEQRQVFDRLIASPEISPFRDFASVDIGIVTGANSYFLLTSQQAELIGVDKTSLRVVCRAGDLRGLKLLRSDWEHNAAKNRRVYLFSPNGRVLRRKTVREYVDEGEKAGVHLGYKCSIRDPWYRTPSIWTPDALMWRQIWMAPRLVCNTAGVVPTDTIHRVKVRPNVSLLDLVCVFHNSLTFAAAELFGRSYGGGVLELEPSEAERLPLPFLGGARGMLAEADEFVRNGDIESAVSLVDHEVLLNTGRISESDLDVVRSIRRKLSTRRHIRQRSQRATPVPST